MSEIVDKLKKLAEDVGILPAKPEFKNPERGDVIFAVRVKTLYFHYGVYVGNNQVIHFNDPNPDKKSKFQACIIRTSLKEFADGDIVFIEPDDESIPHNTKRQTAQKAEQLYLDSTKNYNLALNNCEHFANLCRYNKKKSSQVSKFLKIILPSVLINVPRVMPLPPYIKIPASVLSLFANHFLSNRGKVAHLKQISPNLTK